MLRWLWLLISIGIGCVSYTGQPGGPRDAIVGAGNLPPQPAARAVLTGKVVAGNTSLSSDTSPAAGSEQRHNAGRPGNGQRDASG